MTKPFRAALASVILAAVLALALGGCGQAVNTSAQAGASGQTAPPPGSSGQTASPADGSAANAPEIPDQSADYGASVNDFYVALGDNEVVPFTVTDKAQAFLTAHPDLFPASGESAADGYIDYSLDTKHVNKNPDSCGDRFMYLDDVYVSQIFETDLTSGLTLTELNVADINLDQYYVLYIGKLGGVFEGNEVSVVGLPLNTSSFENTGGGTTLVIVLAGSYIQKLD